MTWNYSGTKIDAGNGNWSASASWIGLINYCSVFSSSFCISNDITEHVGRYLTETGEQWQCSIQVLKFAAIYIAVPDNRCLCCVIYLREHLAKLAIYFLAQYSDNSLDWTSSDHRKKCAKGKIPKLKLPCLNLLSRAKENIRSWNEIETLSFTMGLTWMWISAYVECFKECSNFCLHLCT